MEGKIVDRRIIIGLCLEVCLKEGGIRTPYDSG